MVPKRRRIPYIAGDGSTSVLQSERTAAITVDSIYLSGWCGTMNPRAAAIIIEGDKVLLVHRLKGEREYWVLPGGSIESGESQEQACCREVKEETGLDIGIVDHALTLSNEGREEVYYLADVIRGALELGEPERSRQSSSNQYLLEWTTATAFQEINFRPEQLKATIARQLAADDARNVG